MNNPIKILTLVLNIFLFGNVLLNAQDIQYASIVQGQILTIASNQTAMVISFACNFPNQGSVFLNPYMNLAYTGTYNGTPTSATVEISPTGSQPANLTANLPSNYYASGNTLAFLSVSQPSVASPLVFCGPGTLVFSSGNSTQGVLGIKLTTTTISSPGTVLGSGLPSTAVVIPSQTTGPVNIILESSTDLVNWTPTSPGTFGGNNSTNRFFRVRAQAQ